MTAHIQFTKEGYEKLKKDFKEAVESRPFAVADLKKARDMGDLSENGYYKAARMKLSSIDHSIRQFKDFIQRAQVLDDKNYGFVSIGSTVTLSNGKTYKVVGDLEANPSENKISLLSPIGKAIKDKAVNDEAILDSPSGKISYKIIKVS